MLTSTTLFSQGSYEDSINSFIKEYVETHEVVKGEDRKQMQFFPVNEKYRIQAKFEEIKDGKWFGMETSGISRQVYRVYGILHFSLNDTATKLNLYQSQRLMVMEEYKEHLFLPFTDLTNGNDSYETGRYIDIQMSDIKDGFVTIDFNKAYNPYCAYVDGVYNCPIPPAENNLLISISAGEMKYGKD
jgi:uncharacterized protein (DUF1684 family)